MNVLKSELSLYLDQLDINNEEELEDEDLILDDYEEYLRYCLEGFWRRI